MVWCVHGVCSVRCLCSQLFKVAVGFLVFVCLVSIICPRCTHTQLCLVPYSLLLEETFVQVQVLGQRALGPSLSQSVCDQSKAISALVFLEGIGERKLRPVMSLKRSRYQPWKHHSVGLNLCSPMKSQKLLCFPTLPSPPIALLRLLLLF